MKQVVRSAILGGRYQQYGNLLREIPLRERGELLYELVVETESIAVYTALWFMIFEQEEAIYHYYAAKFMQGVFSTIKGSTSAALFHALQACHLEPRNTIYKELYEHLSQNIHIESILDNSSPELKIICRTNNDIETQATETLFMQKLLLADFNSAIETLSTLPLSKINNFLIKIGFQYESLIIYTMACYMIQQKEVLYAQSQALTVISDTLVWVEGAYSSALAHARRIIDLDPQDYTNKEMLLFFHNCPDYLVDDEETVKTCMEILAEDPHNSCALGVLDYMDRRHARALKRGPFVGGDHVVH